jgi:hypothetical protein
MQILEDVLEITTATTTFEVLTHDAALPTFGHITFARGASEGKPVNPGTKFTPDINTVWACWDYWGMNPDLRYSLYWYNNGKEWISFTESWDRTENGSICWHIYWI